MQSFIADHTSVMMYYHSIILKESMTRQIIIEEARDKGESCVEIPAYSEEMKRDIM